MSNIEKFRKYRSLPFVKIGMRIHFDGTKKSFGKITGTDGDRLRIKLDCDKYSSWYHPYWKLTYYDKNNQVIKKYDN